LEGLVAVLGSRRDNSPIIQDSILVPIRTLISSASSVGLIAHLRGEQVLRPSTARWFPPRASHWVWARGRSRTGFAVETTGFAWIDFDCAIVLAIYGSPRDNSPIIPDTIPVLRLYFGLAGLVTRLRGRQVIRLVQLG